MNLKQLAYWYSVKDVGLVGALSIHSRGSGLEDTEDKFSLCVDLIKWHVVRYKDLEKGLEPLGSQLPVEWLRVLNEEIDFHLAAIKLLRGLLVSEINKMIPDSPEPAQDSYEVRR